MTPRRHNLPGRPVRCSGSFLLPALLVVLLGCSAPPKGSAVILDPDAIGSDQGTLIAIEDIRTVAEEMVQSMAQHAGLGQLLSQQAPLRVLVGEFKHRTSIALFDKAIFVNRLLARITNADTTGSYIFLRREPVRTERALQDTDQVASEGLDTMAGADLVLGGEVREIYQRTPQEHGAELQRRTIQYTLYLDRVADGQRVWADSHEVVKQQFIGAVYR